MSDSAANWFVGKEGEDAKGPFTWPQLVESAQRHRIDHDMVVYHEVATRGEWVRALDLTELATAQEDYQSKMAVAPFERKGSITLAEYESIKDGMSLEQVKEIAGEPTALLTSHSVQGAEAKVYIWKAGIIANATLTFQDDRLFSKTQVGLR